jgi:hypothetical protein
MKRTRKVLQTIEEKGASLAQGASFKKSLLKPRVLILESDASLGSWSWTPCRREGEVFATAT